MILSIALWQWCAAAGFFFILACIFFWILQKLPMFEYEIMHLLLAGLTFCVVIACILSAFAAIINLLLSAIAVM